MYIFEAALEYLISILVTGSFFGNNHKRAWRIGQSYGNTFLGNFSRLSLSAFIAVCKKSKGQKACSDFKRYKSGFLYVALCNTADRCEKADKNCIIRCIDMRGVPNL